MADSRITGLPVATTFADTDAFLIDATAAGNRQISGAAMKAQVMALRPFQVTIAGNVFTVSAGTRPTLAGAPVAWAGGTVTGPVTNGTTWLKHTQANTLIFDTVYATGTLDDLVLGRVVTSGGGTTYVYSPFDRVDGDMMNANNLLNLADKSAARVNLQAQYTQATGTTITGAGDTPVTILDSTESGFIRYTVNAGTAAYTRTVSLVPQNGTDFQSPGQRITFEFALPGTLVGPPTIQLQVSGGGAVIWSATGGSVARTELVTIICTGGATWRLVAAGPEPHAGDARLTEDINTRAPAGAIRFDGTLGPFSVGTIRGISLGAGDYTVVLVFRVQSNPDISSSMGVFALSGASNLGGGGGVGLLVGASSSTYQMFVRNSAGTQVAVVVPLAAYVGRTIQYVMTRRVGVVSVLVDGQALSFTPPSSQAEAIVGTDTFLALGNINASLLCYSERIYSMQVFNRALASPELRLLAARGVAPEDRNATGAAQTVGPLVRGRTYLISTYVSGDDFANVGASSNAAGVVFVATGTAPTVWTNASSLLSVGSLVDLDCGVGSGFSLPDLQGRFPAVVTPTAYANFQHTRPSRRGQFLAYVSALGNTQIAGLPLNARISSIVAQVLGGAPVTYSVGNASAGSQIVAAVAIDSPAGRVDAVLVNRYTSTGNLWVNLSAASPIMLTISYDIIG